MELPIDAMASDVVAALAHHGAVIVVAPPGTGKTTRLPLLLNSFRPGRKVIMTEPRRLAARTAAERMAHSLGEPVGATVGYRMRDATKVSAQTRIEVVTEGVLLRMLAQNESLEGVDTVILDEVHERHLDSDFSLALLLDIRSVLRPDLELVVMSATLDDTRLGSLVDAPVVTCDTSLFPVHVHWKPALLAELHLRAAEAALDALRTFGGDVLVFAPGAPELRAIARTLERLGTPVNVDIRTLHGSASVADQRFAISPSAPGRRKIVLSTSIAQTSLTVPGVATVIDCGLQRETRFDPSTGMTRLTTSRVTRSTAVQRAGRAGRLGPGNVVRLWSASEFQRSPRFDQPEILRADLLGVALRLAGFGIAQASSLRWLDPPPHAAWEHATDEMERLGLSAVGRITPQGRRVNELGLDPRLGSLLLAAQAHGRERFREAALACAILDDPDAVRRSGRSEGLADLIAATNAGRPGLQTLARRADRLQRMVGEPLDPSTNPAVTLAGLISHAYPQRVAVRDVSNAHRFTLAGGTAATVLPDSVLAGERYLAVVDIDADRHEGTIWSALPLTTQDIEFWHGASLLTVRSVHVEPTRGGLSVLAKEEVRLGHAVLRERPTPPSRMELTEAIERTLSATDVVQMLLVAERTGSLRARMLVARCRDQTLPDWTFDALLADRDLFTELAAEVQARSPTQAPSPTAVLRLDDAMMAQVLQNRLHYAAQQALRHLAPEKLSLSNGRTIAVTYQLGQESEPGGESGHATAASRVQDFFGLTTGPSVADGMVPVVLTLLSPAGRPTAVTGNLPSFWQTGYPRVRAELRGRYPKHPWPEDPASAAPPPRPGR